MKRFHVHVAVNDLEVSVRFYSKLFGSEPTLVKPDYAKWMVEDPREILSRVVYGDLIRRRFSDDPSLSLRLRF